MQRRCCCLLLLCTAGIDVLLSEFHCVGWHGMSSQLGLQPHVMLLVPLLL
jgi:hypothetical protein